jgi:hypothetical protein
MLCNSTVEAVMAMAVLLVLPRYHFILSKGKSVV